MKIPEITVTKRRIGMEHVCDFCGSTKDGALFLNVDISDEADVNGEEMYVSFTRITACVHNGCAERLIGKLDAVKAQCKMSDEVSAATML